MAEQDYLNSETIGKKWGNRFSSHFGTLVFSGLVLIGFIIACLFGGFPSILIPSLVILAIGLVADLLSINSESTPKKAESVKPLKAVFIIVAFFLFLAWISEALLPLFSGPNLNKILRKVEYPFSEANYVITDSKGEIYIHSEFNNRIQKYSKDGKFQFGWFGAHPRQKHTAMVIDENDFIYTYWDWVIRKFDNKGNMISEICKSRDDRGWWRQKNDAVVWDPNAKEPKKYDEFNSVVKDGDLLPGTELDKNGFKTADAKYYKIVRLWHLFPVVSVSRYLSNHEGYIMPNPLSLIFTFVFPGFLFYAIALIMSWIFEKQKEKLVRLKHALIIVTIFLISTMAITIGGSIVISIANALPRSNPIHFWLVPLIAIPYCITIIIASLWIWRSILRQLNKSSSRTNKGD